MVDIFKFELTKEQQEIVEQHLEHAERESIIGRKGVVFCQIYESGVGAIMCKGHFLDTYHTVEIKRLISNYLDKEALKDSILCPLPEK